MNVSLLGRRWQLSDPNIKDYVFRDFKAVVSGSLKKLKPEKNRPLSKI